MTTPNQTGEILPPPDVLDGTYLDLLQEDAPAVLPNFKEVISARKAAYLQHEALADEFEIPVWD